LFGAHFGEVIENLYWGNTGLRKVHHLGQNGRKPFLGQYWIFEGTPFRQNDEPLMANAGFVAVHHFGKVVENPHWSNTGFVQHTINWANRPKTSIGPILVL
jgi:hypothetical protein